LTDAQRDRATGTLARQLREVTGLVNDLIEPARDEEPAPLLEEVRIAALAEHAVAAARAHWPAKFSPEGLPVEVELTTSRRAGSGAGSGSRSGRVGSGRLSVSN
jgi:two-component system sensor histidine kinase MprB